MWHIVIIAVLFVLLVVLFFFKRKMERIIDDNLTWREFFVVFLAWIMFGRNKSDTNDDLPCE